MIDSDSGNDISEPEFKTKMNLLQIGLDVQEAEAMFRKMDKDRGGSIDFNEFVDMFKELNIDIIVSKIKDLLVKQGMDPEYFFNMHAQQDPKHEQCYKAVQ